MSRAAGAEELLVDEGGNKGPLVPFTNDSLTTNDWTANNHTTGLEAANGTSVDVHADVLRYIWLLGVIVLLPLILMCLRPKRQVGGNAQRARDRRREQARREVIKADPQRRFRYMKKSLITKRVVGAEDTTTNTLLRLGDLSGNSVVSSASIVSTENDNNMCAVCIGSFQKGDLVTWSRELQCRHVFHQECLNEWLANPKHDDCPSCRCRIIHDDGEEKEDTDIETGSSRRSCSGAVFCIMNGLIAQQGESNPLLGTTVDLTATNPLRRVLSSTTTTGTTSRRLGLVALRRVSSEFYSRALGSRRAGHDDDEVLKKSPIPLRRTQSEGPGTPCLTPCSSCQVSNSHGPHATLDSSSPPCLDMDFSPDTNLSPPRLSLRTTGGLGLTGRTYSQLQRDYGGEVVDIAEDDLSDEESLIEPLDLSFQSYDAGDIELAATSSRSEG